MRAFAAAAVFVGCVVVACGGSGLPAADRGSSGSDVPASSSGLGTSSSSGGEMTKSSVCEELQKTSNCDCTDVKVITDQPNLYFVLDRSGSMNEDNKWATMQQTVVEVVRDIGNRAKFGVALFPGSTQQCGPGGGVLRPLAGDAPGVTGPTVTAFSRAISTAAGGPTPTAATLSALLAPVKAFEGRTFVILATDGAPNCGDSACDAASCILNIENYSDPSKGISCPPMGTSCCDTLNRGQCVDSDKTNAAVKAYADSNIPVYVIGVPGSGPYEGILERLATTGGTARGDHPFYYKVDSTSKDALKAALRKVAAKITATCDFTLSTAIDPGQVNVYLDGKSLAPDASNGWTLVDTKVALVGTACDRVKNGDVLSVQIVAGCPTTQIK